MGAGRSFLGYGLGAQDVRLHAYFEGRREPLLPTDSSLNLRVARDTWMVPGLERQGGHAVD